MRIKATACLLAALLMTACTPAGPGAKTSVSESFAELQKEAAGRTLDGNSTLDLMKAAAMATAQAFPGGYVIDSEDGLRSVVVFANDGWTYCADLRRVIPWADSFSASMYRVRNETQENLNISVEDGAVVSTNYFARDPFYSMDETGQKMMPLLIMESQDAFALIAEFPDYFEGTLDSADPVILNWKPADSKALNEKIRGSRFSKTGAGFPDGFQVQIFMDPNGIIKAFESSDPLGTCPSTQMTVRTIEKSKDGLVHLFEQAGKEMDDRNSEQ